MGNLVLIDTDNEVLDIEKSERDILCVLDRLDVGHVALVASEIRPPGKDAKATFIDKEEFGRGRNEGQHGARFGQLIINGAGIWEAPAPVVLKPFNYDVSDSPNDQLAREWATNDYVNSVSQEQLAYLPLGVWKNVEGINHLITLYEHDVVSYDNIFWQDRDAHPESLRKEVLENAYHQCLTGLGYLHGVGVAHNDAEAKNLASDRRGIRFIDLETATKIDYSNLDLATLATRNDIETFIDSTLQVDDNRDLIEAVLTKRDVPQRFARLYRAGIRAASIDTGNKPPKLYTTTDRYFEDTIDHARKVASNRHAHRLDH